MVMRLAFESTVPDELSVRGTDDVVHAPAAAGMLVR